MRAVRRTVGHAVRIGLILAISLLLAGIALRAFVSMAYPLKYQALVERYSARNGLPSDLVYGVIHTESGFRPDAISPVGARGLMQITQETFEWARSRMGDPQTQYDDLYDAETNIKYGTYILSILLAEFKTPDTALAAYNAGWGSVKGWLSEQEHSLDGQTLDSIPYGETARYIPKVHRARTIYKTLYS